MNSNRKGIFAIPQEFTVTILTILPLLYIGYSFYKMYEPTNDIGYLMTFILSLCLAIILYLINDYMIPKCKDLLLNAGLSGKDLNKPGKMEDKKPM